DVMSMAHGIEIRVPFLDKKFINLSLSIGSKTKYAGRPKQLLIDSFSNELPEQIWNRPKMGFSFPFAQWLAKSEFAKDTMSDGGTAGINNFVRFTKGEMHWSQFMSLLLLNKISNSKSKVKSENTKVPMLKVES
ncbi:MAG TPA: asparagine synthase-related protein, partial [Ferruginibacter sp.]|nr:asparagine synthase-related protein [Ferruginibacter sp.]